MSNGIAMNNNQITTLASGTVSNHAARIDQTISDTSPTIAGPLNAATFAVSNAASYNGVALTVTGANSNRLGADGVYSPIALSEIPELSSNNLDSATDTAYRNIYVYGQLYMDGSQEQNLTTSYSVITNMISTNLVGITATHQNLTVTDAGVFFCAFSISFEGDTSQEYEAAVFVEDVEQDNIEAQRRTSNNDIANCGANGILNLDAGDTVNIRVKSLTGGSDFDPNKVQLTLYRIN